MEHVLINHSPVVRQHAGVRHRGLVSPAVVFGEGGGPLQPGRFMPGSPFLACCCCCCCAASVVSNSVQPHQAPPSLGFSRQEHWSGLPLPSPMHAKSLQSCPTLCDPVDSSPPGSPVPGILQARTQEWVPFPSPFMVWKIRFDAQVRCTAVQRRCHQRAT